MSASGKWRIDETGLLVVEEVHAKRGTFEEGITTYDEDTGTPYCIKVKSGASITMQGECKKNSIDNGTDGLVK